MSIGYQAIQDTIYKQLVQARVDVPGGRGKFSKDLAKKIYELMEGDTVQWNLAHNFPQHLEPLVRRIEKGLKVNIMKRTPESVKVYEWIAEQEQGGKDLNVFFQWAIAPERVRYIGKYFSKPEWLMVDFLMAYGDAEQKTFTANEDGSLYV
jgi:hypothetical protein